MAPKGDGGIAQVCHGSDYWFITLLLEHTHTHTRAHTFPNSHTVAEGGGIEETIKYICPAPPPPLSPPPPSTSVEIEHFSEDYWLETQEVGGRQQMRPDRTGLPAVSGPRLSRGWEAGKVYVGGECALGTWAGGWAVWKVGCVNLTENMKLLHGV